MAILMMPMMEMPPPHGQRSWNAVAQPLPPQLRPPTDRPADSLWNQEWGSVQSQQWLTLPSWPQSSTGSGGCWRPSWVTKAGEGNAQQATGTRGADSGRAATEAVRAKGAGAVSGSASRPISGDANEPRGSDAGESCDVPDDELPSIGSKGHAEGLCKRCAFFSKGRCQNGRDCSHCHYNHEERKRYRKRGQRSHDTRAEVPATEAMVVGRLQGVPATRVLDSSRPQDAYMDLAAKPTLPEVELEELEEEEEEQLRHMMAKGLTAAKGLSDSADCEPLCAPCASEDTEADTSAPSEAAESLPEATREAETPPHERSSMKSVDSDLFTPPLTPVRRRRQRDSGSSSCSSPDREANESVRPRLAARSPTKSPSASLSPSSEVSASLSPASPHCDEDLPAAEEIMRTARSLLNKLSEDNFERLSEKILALDLTTSAQMSALVAEVFRAATSQRCFLPLYAEVCQRVDAKLAADASSATGGKAFRKALVSECQASFEKHLAQARPDAAKLQGLGYEDRYCEEAALKGARLGNMRFIGELLVRRLIASKVLLALMNELQSGDEDAVESLVALLSVAGPHFDSKTNTLQSASIKDTFACLQRRSTEKDLSMRLRFQIRDLLEAREKGWETKSPA